MQSFALPDPAGIKFAEKEKEASRQRFVDLRTRLLPEQFAEVLQRFLRKFQGPPSTMVDLLREPADAHARSLLLSMAEQGAMTAVMLDHKKADKKTGGWNGYGQS
jgi:hypothetical protein